MRMFCLSAAACRSETIWQDVAPFFEYFERKTGEISAEQVRAGAIAEQLQIWGLQDAEQIHLVAATELAQTPKGLVCTLRIGCGSAPKALQERLLDEIGKWAKSLGATRMRIVGRQGWLRRFRRFRATAVVMECEL